MKFHEFYIFRREEKLFKLKIEMHSSPKSISSSSPQSSIMSSYVDEHNDIEKDAIDKGTKILIN